MIVSFLTFKEKGIDQRPLTPLRWSNQEDVDIETIRIIFLERTRQWLSLRIQTSATKEKKKGKAANNPQTKSHKEYVRRTRSDSRKNTSVELEEATIRIDN